ncbi:glycosyltransferase family 4 protein [candidate division WOR-3 bacterium]|nr:glycosyltransferase family 4 protein [candidate division WOR-3 bacterium]
MTQAPLRVGIDASAFGAVKGGIARYLYGMVSEMTALDGDAQFIFYTPRPVEVALPGGNCRVRSGTGLLGLNLWMQGCVPEWVAEDRLHVFWGQNQAIPLILRHRCFRLLTVHDLAPFVIPQTLRFHSALAHRFLLARACHVADKVITDSDATAKAVIRLVGVRPDRVARVYLGAEARFRPVPRSVAYELATRKYGLPEDYLLTIGTVEPRKNHAVLLHALRMTKCAPVLAIVGGIGWKSEPIVAEIAAMEKAGRVRYLGWVDDDDLPYLYSAAKLFVLPSIYEGFGLPVLEAMACGCPVLCSWSSSLPEVGGTAVSYCSAGSSVDLARKLDALLSDEPRRTAMSAAGLSRAKRFDLTHSAGQVLDIMRRGAE